MKDRGREADRVLIDFDNVLTLCYFDPCLSSFEGLPRLRERDWVEYKAEGLLGRKSNLFRLFRRFPMVISSDIYRGN